jgi:hypothetical protein
VKHAVRFLKHYTLQLPPTSTPNAASFIPAADDVFGRIAARYDFLNDVFSFGIHRLWKRRVARVIAAEDWQNLLGHARKAK